jgi:cytochrome c oxidase subunit 2
MWFTPTKTTKQMREETQNPAFMFEISCDQMCGRGHYTMRGEIIVEAQEEFDAWILGKKPKYFAAFPEKDPSAQKPAADTTKPAATTPATAATTTGSH